jgi:hypothetical protein
MKKTISLLFLFLGCAVFGQNQTTAHRFLPILSSVNLKPFSFQINFNKSNLFSKTDNITLYNPITNLNDNYYVLGKDYVMSNTKSFPIYGFEGRQVDSFNPSGTKDLGSAFVFGAINSILGKL